MKSQKGSAHVIVTILLVVALLGALGFIFWQNVISKNSSLDTTANSAMENKNNTNEPKTTDKADMVSETKDSVQKAMSQEQYIGLQPLMTNPISGAVANSDGIFINVSPDALTEALFGTYSRNTSANRYTWSFSDFKDLNHEALKKQASETTFFDFKDSYVAVGKPSSSNYGEVFAAFKINAEGKITYIFSGGIQ